MKTWIVLSTVVLATTFKSVAAGWQFAEACLNTQVQNLEVKPCTLHLMLACNTSDAVIGSNGTNVQTELTRLYTDIAKACRISIQIHNLSGDKLTRSYVTNYLENFSCSENDVVAFHFFGHGGRIHEQDSDWPTMLMKPTGWGELVEKGLLVDEVKRLIYYFAGPRLTLIFADCCNKNTKESQPMPVIETTSSEGDLDHSIQDLFLGESGYVISSSASPGEYSQTLECSTTYFTVYLDHYFRQSMKTGASWSQLVDQVAIAVADDTTQQGALNQTTQTPQSVVNTRTIAFTKSTTNN